MVEFRYKGEVLWQRMERAVERVNERLRKTVSVLEHPEASARDAVHVTLVGQMIRPDDIEPNPDIVPSETADDFRTLPLEALVRMKLNSYRRKDQVQLLDMISVGLIDGSWPHRFPDKLGGRLQRLLDDPDG